MRRSFHARKFDMQNEDDLMEFERIKQRVIIDKTPGWAIVSQSQTSNKYGDVFVLLEWMEPV